MSRSNHPTSRNYDSHPYWRYGWWSRHTGNRRSKRGIRQLYNRIERAREKQAIREGRDPPRRRKYIAWIYW
jgi:hypothetical protein